MFEPPAKRSKYDPDQQRNLDELTLVQERLDNLQDDNYAELKRIERRYDALQRPFIQQRNELAQSIPNFWLTSLKKHPKLTRLIRTAEEEICLNHLTKIDVVEFENNSGYSIRFHFEDNPFFKNKILTKEYRKNPTSFTRHSPINWKNHNKTSKGKRSKNSFFGWYTDSRAKIETDNIGRMFREELWKNPLVFYTLPLDLHPDEDDVEGKTDGDDAENINENASMLPKLPLRPLIVCGPSGSGKSTFLKRMLEEFPDRFCFTVSHTTRLPRPGEVDGRHYHFTDEETMKRDIRDGKFVETALFGGNYYGTSLSSVEDVAKSGKVAVLDIDVEGVKQVKNTGLNPWGVFVKPPSMEALRQRLTERRTESDDSLQRRLARAEEEMKYGATPGNFDLVVVNDDLARAYKEFRKFVLERVLKK